MKKINYFMLSMISIVMFVCFLIISCDNNEDTKEVGEKTYDMVFVDSPPAQAPFARLNTLIYAFKKSNTIILHDCKRYAEQNSLRLLKRLYKFDINTFEKDKGLAILKIILKK